MAYRKMTELSGSLVFDEDPEIQEPMVHDPQDFSRHEDSGRERSRPVRRIEEERRPRGGRPENPAMSHGGEVRKIAAQERERHRSIIESPVDRPDFVDHRFEEERPPKRYYDRKISGMIEEEPISFEDPLQGSAGPAGPAGSDPLFSESALPFTEPPPQPATPTHASSKEPESSLPKALPYVFAFAIICIGAYYFLRTKRKF